MADSRDLASLKASWLADLGADHDPLTVKEYGGYSNHWPWARVDEITDATIHDYLRAELRVVCAESGRDQRRRCSVTNRYNIEATRLDPVRGVHHVYVGVQEDGDLDAAKRLADAQDTHAMVCIRGTIYHDNGKPEAPWTEEQIARYEASPLRRMTKEQRDALSALNHKMARTFDFGLTRAITASTKKKAR